MPSINPLGTKVFTLLAAGVLLLALGASLFFLRAARPELFRKKTFMERNYPVCVLGVSERTGVLTGDKAGIRNIYINFKTSFPAKAVKAIRASGAVPMITWEPYLERLSLDELLPAIAAGKYDAYIKRFARNCNGPLFIRFAHEPNSDWYGWSGVKSGPAEYIKAFRRVKDLFRGQGNSSVKFIFSMNGEDVPAEPWNRFENYYPGDDYADIIGLDVYNWGDGPQAWQKWMSPGKMLSGPYERVVKAFPSKPVFLTETASGDSGGAKELWIGQLLNSIGRRFPAVKAVVWFDFKKERDWSLSSDELRRSYYGACGAGRIECSAKSFSWIFKEQL